MRRSIWRSIRRAWKCYAWIALLSGGAAVVPAAPAQALATDSRASAHSQVETPMTGKGVGVAPYSVRLRITGFLARQHARDGDSHRALLEFYSMLNVDDPTWPDNEQGDSLRIARDIEVAQMMAESGFYEHAVRILQTTHILARVNQDPQVTVVERQMHAVADLAAAKGVPVPPIDVTFGDAAVASSALAASTRSANSAARDDVSTVAATESAPAVSNVEQANSEPVLPELPKSSLPAKSKHDSVAATGKPQQKSLFDRLVPSRRRAEKDENLAANHSAKPAIAPDQSPTYCQACSGVHGHPAHAGATHARNHNRPFEYDTVRPKSSATDDAMSAPAAPSSATTNDQRMFSRLLGRKRSDSDAAAKPSVATTANKSGPAAAPQPTKTAAKANTEDPVTLMTHESQHESPAIEQTSADSPVQEPTAPQPIDDSSTVETEPDMTDAPEAIQIRRQVGVAGQIPNPGILTIEGTSTTLAAILRRAGESPNPTEKRIRILRSVQLQGDPESMDLSKDFFCQRVEVLQPTAKELDTPVYDQEIVIVDGTAQKPVYISVMPHFILQIPHNADSPVSADQIVEQLRVYWPNIREQEIGVLRFEQWSRAAKLARLQDADVSTEAALDAGDVLYIDGTGLDNTQVLPAARSIARLAGAKIRAQAPASQAAATEE